MFYIYINIVFLYLLIYNVSYVVINIIFEGVAMSKTVSVFTEKGGVGKTNITLMLAGAAAAKGLNVLVVDEDTQGTCIMLANDESNTFTFKVQTTYPKKTNDYDLIIVDMAPNTNTIPRGIVILPYQPTRVSYAVSARHMDALIENCERVIPVVTFLDLRKIHHKEFYRSVPSLSVKARAIYERATDLSSTIFSVGFENLSGAREARKEFNALLNEVLK